jgi:hypothetical protein
MDRAKESYARTARKADIALLQHAVYDDVPTIVLDAQNAFYAYNSDLRNWHPNPVSPFDDMLNVDI